MLKISCAGCLGAFLVLDWCFLRAFRCNLLLKCGLQPKIAKNLLKTPLLGVQDRSRSSMLIKLKSPCPVLVMIGNLSVLICNRFHTRRANSGKITFFF